MEKDEREVKKKFLLYDVSCGSSNRIPYICFVDCSKLKSFVITSVKLQNFCVLFIADTNYSHSNFIFITHNLCNIHMTLLIAYQFERSLCAMPICCMFL